MLSIIQKDKFSFSIENVNKENDENIRDNEYWKIPNGANRIVSEPKESFLLVPTPIQDSNKEQSVPTVKKRGRPKKVSTAVKNAKNQPRNTRGGNKRVPFTPETSKLDVEHFNCQSGLSTFSNVFSRSR